VVGSYELYNGTTDMGQHAFWWSLPSGFHDLGALVNGGLTANGWLTLSTADYTQNVDANGSPIYIVGAGQLSTMSGGQMVYELTATPEPKWTLALCGLAAGLGILVRRRSRLFFALQRI
jgi:hypothetical protein